MVKTKPNQKIHVDKLNSTLEQLDKLEKKPKSELNLRESIYFLRDKLKSALKKGYSYQDLSTILEEQEILISASTLKQYLTDISKESASKRKRSKSGKSHKTTSSASNYSQKSSAKKLDPTLSESESEQELIQAKSNHENNDLKIDLTNNALSKEQTQSSQNKTNKELNSHSSSAKKSSKNQPKELSRNQQDFADDFNQY